MILGWKVSQGFREMGELFEAEPVEIGEMLFAGIGEGEAEIDEAGGKVF